MGAYVAASLRVGEAFVLSRYEMYAELRGRAEGAIFYVRAGDALVGAQRLDRFVGVDTNALTPTGFPCSQEWVVWETRRWIEDHRAPAARDDAVPVELGFRIVSVRDFRLSERVVPLARGHAHWRGR
jgi:hypothetical protein